jgi:hypothetical protein
LHDFPTSQRLPTPQLRRCHGTRCLPRHTSPIACLISSDTPPLRCANSQQPHSHNSHSSHSQSEPQPQPRQSLADARLECGTAPRLTIVVPRRFSSRHSEPFECAETQRTDILQGAAAAPPTARIDISTTCRGRSTYPTCSLRYPEHDSERTQQRRHPATSREHPPHFHRTPTNLHCTPTNLHCTPAGQRLHSSKLMLIPCQPHHRNPTRQPPSRCPPSHITTTIAHDQHTTTHTTPALSRLAAPSFSPFVLTLQ